MNSLPLALRVFAVGSAAAMGAGLGIWWSGHAFLSLACVGLGLGIFLLTMKAAEMGASP